MQREIKCAHKGKFSQFQRHQYHLWRQTIQTLNSSALTYYTSTNWLTHARIRIHVQHLNVKWLFVAVASFPFKPFTKQFGNENLSLFKLISFAISRAAVSNWEAIHMEIYVYSQRAISLAIKMNALPPVRTYWMEDSDGAKISNDIRLSENNDILVERAFSMCAVEYTLHNGNRCEFFYLLIAFAMQTFEIEEKKQIKWYHIPKTDFYDWFFLKRL